ncbi:DUF456 domain-containing protein [Staphylococcus intermedius]|uniref:Putative glycine-zipper protein n=1 Tax=Staphylococcus intermedius NCTC 11048 TaxID=1141106 RepID=A0A380G9W8_STAIN|nr:DUF456 domain-containing protein [Staphylococcus intermedius]PCF65518.1 hypothetical protein B5C04_05550 [Staphylococcus intermedius]PCF81195.1 hypothetical protein B4W74_05900 [Staphylococcus intermedius]PCF82478.1 hypothetical protein B4W70_05545 [Staphylococcus intermedius]PCF87178.1 hypothetical protein B4W75_08815 [Staphylococcus intermedius]PCF87737.1 hypothetical protein B4W76_04940 [Staphylococcus intermedius]
MSDVILWVLVLAAFVLAFIGLIKPIIPAIPVLWIGFLIYQFGINGATLSWIFWTAMMIFTIFIFVSDLWLNRYFVNRFGGTKKGEWAALIGVLVGVFVLPPFGVVIVPFIAVMIVEMMQSKNLMQAIKASIGSLIAFFSSAVMQAMLMFVMIIWFFIDALLIN